MSGVGSGIGILDGVHVPKEKGECQISKQKLSFIISHGALYQYSERKWLM